MAHVEADPDRTVVEKLDPRLGMVLGGRYRIEHKLAAGGFGAVYRGTDQDGSAVAIKVLHPELANDPAVSERFRREAGALALLTDPHTVCAFDAGEAPDGTLYLVMELLSGESLYEHYRAHGPLAWRRVVAIARGVCSSLAEAHALGIIHRDLKPANIHLERRGDDPDYVKVIDFGFAKSSVASSFNGDVTQVGQMIGTYDYMPTEQMIGSCTPQSDVFTLGVVMYEMIAGRRPYGESKGPAAQLAALLGTTPAMLDNVPPELARIIAKCISREPEDRYPDAAALAADLEPFATIDQLKTRAIVLDPSPCSPGEAVTWLDRRAHPLPLPMPLQAHNTLPGVAIPHALARGSNDGIEAPRARLASGTSPIVEPSFVAPGSGTSSNLISDLGAAQHDQFLRRLAWVMFALVVLAIVIALVVSP